MQNIRLTLALEAGLSLPEQGPIAVFRPRGDTMLAPLPVDRITAIQSFAPDAAQLKARGIKVAPREEGSFAASVVFLPRAKDECRALIARAMAVTTGPVIIDGSKTDGIESVLKDMRKRADLAPAISKAHGKIFWCDSTDAFADWNIGPTANKDGYVTAPGVFSANGVDKASAALVAALPAKLGRAIGDFGAGWGYLSAQVLPKHPEIETLHLVEAEAVALDCARQNVTDPRAKFHWADVSRWQTPQLLDGVIMNPPFHTSRAADPALGQAFLQAGHSVLAPGGRLWVVANRHLPYENTLTGLFAQVSEIGGDASFKVLEAVRPKRRV